MNLPHHRSSNISLAKKFAKDFEVFRTQYQLYTVVIFDNLDIFKEMFLKDETVWDIVDVEYNGQGIRFVWVAWEGNHIVSEISSTEFVRFLEEVESVYG